MAARGGPIKAVLFDLDGTLVKAGGAGRRALNRAAKRLHGHPDVCSTFSLQGRLDRHNFRLAFANATGKKPKAGDLRALEAAYLRHLPHEVRKAVRRGTYAELPGVSRLIRALARRKDVLIGLGTGNLEKGAAVKLGPSGLLPYFKFGGYGTDGRTRAQMLRTAVRRAEALAGRLIRPEHVFVIGDTARDVLAGKEAGYRTGAVTGGFGDAGEIEKSRPELLARDFSDARVWLDWIRGRGGPLTCFSPRPRRRAP